MGTSEENHARLARMEEIYERYKKTMAFVAFQIVGNHQDVIDDIVQDTLVKVMLNFDQIKDTPVDQLKPLLCVMTRNTTYDQKRRVHGQISLEDPELERLLYDGIDTTCERVLNKVEFGSLIKMKGLQPQYKEILLLRYYYDLDDETVAGILGIQHGAERARLCRAKKQARLLLEKEEKRDE